MKKDDAFEDKEKHWTLSSVDYNANKYNKDDISKEQFLIRQEIVIDTMIENGIKSGSLLDCGCGNGENIVALHDKGFNVDGFDISEGMLKNVRNNLQINNINNVNLWQDNICSFSSKIKNKYDVAFVMGVLQYLNHEERKKAYKEIYNSTTKDADIVISYVNSLFNIFTFNKYTVDFFKENIFPLGKWSDSDDNLSEKLSSLITNSEYKKTGKRSETAQGYVPIHSSNPFLIEQELLDNGFKMTDMKFFHFHSLPPLMKDIISEESEFYINSHNMEKKYSKSWLGNFMAFQFFVTAKKL